MQIIKYHLEPLAMPVDGYCYIVRAITSVDGGRTFFYCGDSRYFRTQTEAAAYKADREAQKQA